MVNYMDENILEAVLWGTIVGLGIAVVILVINR